VSDQEGGAECDSPDPLTTLADVAHWGGQPDEWVSHSVVVTPANVHDKLALPQLLHGERGVPMVTARAPASRSWSYRRRRTPGTLQIGGPAGMGRL